MADPLGTRLWYDDQAVAVVVRQSGTNAAHILALVRCGVGSPGPTSYANTAARSGINSMKRRNDNSLGGRQSQEVARGMQEAASHACGHEVQVKGELIWWDAAEDAGAPIWAE